MQFFNNSKVGVIVGAWFVSTHFESAEGIQVQDGGLTAACVAGGLYAGWQTALTAQNYCNALKNGHKDAKGISGMWAKRQLKQQVAKTVSQVDDDKMFIAGEQAAFKVGDFVQIGEDKFFIVVGYITGENKSQYYGQTPFVKKYALQKVEREIPFEVDGNFKTIFTVKPQISFYKADDDKLKKMHFTDFNPVEVLNKQNKFSTSSSDANSIIKIPVGAVFTAPANQSGEANVEIKEI